MAPRGLLCVAVCTVAAALPLLAPSQARAQRSGQSFTADEPLSDELVRQAIQAGIDYLWRVQNAQTGGWEYYTPEQYQADLRTVKPDGPLHTALGIYGGSTSLVLLSLLNSGVSQDDARFQKALKLVLAAQPRQVYARALRGGLLASLNRPGDYRAQIEAEKAWLLRAMYADGTYGYFLPANPQQQVNPGSARRDLSNTQYGVLGMWLISDFDFEVPHRYWQRVQLCYVKNQARDGGWAYRPGEAASGYQSMTLGALASLYIVWDRIYTANCDQQPDPELRRSIELGLEWLSTRFQAAGNYGSPHSSKFPLYTVYGVERVGVASGRKYFGQINWWDRCARHVLSIQRPDGSWPGEHDKAPAPVATAWALLFLSYGRAPVVFNKLQYGPEQQWNARPRDLARLTVWMGRTYERLFNWQIMPIDRPLAELLDAPILLMSGSGPIELTAEQKSRLKDYILGGGLLLGEATAGSRAFADSFRALMAELFPELELNPLAADHPLLRQPFQLDRARGEGALPPPTLEGLSNGVRVMALLSPSELGCTWQRYDVVRGRSYFELAANLSQYVSDRFTGLLGRGTSYLVHDRGNHPGDPVRVGRLTWGNRYQWDPEPFAWSRQDVLLRNAGLPGVRTVPLDFEEPVEPRKAPVVHLTGVGRLDLPATRQRNLRQYVADGGLLLVDAAGGDAAFADSFAGIARELFGVLAPGGPPFVDRATDGGRTEQRHVDGLPRAVRPLTVLGWQPEPGRWGVLFLPRDLTAAMTGYANIEPVGLTPQAADRFVAALVRWLGEREPRADR